METFIDLNPAALPPRKRLKSLGSSASPPSTPTTPPPRPSPTSASIRTEPLNQSGMKRKIPEPNEKEERFAFSNQNVPSSKAAMFNMRGDVPSPSPSDSEPEQPRRGRPGRKPGSSSKKPIKRQRKDDEPLYCLCRQPYDEEVFMIACDVCNDWFHGECVGMTERKAQSLKIYICPPCTKSRAAGQRRRSVVKVSEGLEDVEVNVEDEDDDEDQYEKENYHEYQQQRRKRAKGQPAAARGRTKGAIPGSSTTLAARRRSIGANGIGGVRKSHSMIEDDPNHVAAGETDSSKEDVMPRRVCVNKDCNNSAKPQSKYCSTECGVRVATQFLEMQKAAAVAAAEPARTSSPKSSPKPRDVSLHSSSEENLVNFTLIKRSLENSPDISAADDSDLRHLESLERQRGEVEHNLRSLATKREEFAKAVQFSTTLFAATASTNAGDDSTRMEDQLNGADRGSQEGVEVMDCFSCGQPIPGRNFGRHIEQCYAKKEGISCQSPSLSSAPAVLSAHKLHSRTLDNGAVIIYCNHFDARSGGGYCAHPLDSCPLHSDKRGSDERRLCGCPTGDFESGHCERLRSDCVKHFNWENIRKMEMKLEKKRQTQLLSSLHAEIELVKSRIRRRNQTRDDQHRTIEENGATYTRQHSPASK